MWKNRIFVAPFVGAWIEITMLIASFAIKPVAPFVGAWIEIMSMLLSSIFAMSLRSSERGLKL